MSPRNAGWGRHILVALASPAHCLALLSGPDATAKLLHGARPNDNDVTSMSLLRQGCGTDVVRPGPEAGIATDAGLPGGTGGAAEVNAATRHNEESGLWRTGHVRTWPGAHRVRKKVPRGTPRACASDAELGGWWLRSQASHAARETRARRLIVGAM